MPCRKKWSVGERKQFILLLRWVSVAHPGGSSSSYKQTQHCRSFCENTDCSLWLRGFYKCQLHRTWEECNWNFGHIQVKESSQLFECVPHWAPNCSQVEIIKAKFISIYPEAKTLPNYRWLKVFLIRKSRDSWRCWKPLLSKSSIHKRF